MATQGEDTVAQFRLDVEHARVEYLRMKEAGNQVTAKEVAAVRQTYEDALEKLSGAFHRSRLENGEGLRGKADARPPRNTGGHVRQPVAR